MFHAQDSVTPNAPKGSVIQTDPTEYHPTCKQPVSTYSALTLLSLFSGCGLGDFGDFGSTFTPGVKEHI